jgi:leucyl/phenylalanyl-tRNA--protein transferase
VKLTILNPYQPNQAFPSVSKALKDPEGLLAIGGCLSTTRIINAYRNGIFPWFNPDDPILWWSPDPRSVLFPQQLHISRRLAKTLRSTQFTFSIDQAFSQVIEACSGARDYAHGTWITDEIKQAYTKLYEQGIAHSAEVWSEGQLVGGLYGVALGQIFFGESMFHTKTDASKVAFANLVKYLIAWNYQLIDCQVHNPHLASLGATQISRDAFITFLDRYCNSPSHPHAWQF